MKYGGMTLDQCELQAGRLCYFRLRVCLPDTHFAQKAAKVSALSQPSIESSLALPGLDRCKKTVPARKKNLNRRQQRKTSGFLIFLRYTALLPFYFLSYMQNRSGFFVFNRFASNSGPSFAALSMASIC
jgi:hypothetical protein